MCRQEGAMVTPTLSSSTTKRQKTKAQAKEMLHDESFRPYAASNLSSREKSVSRERAGMPSSSRHEGELSLSSLSHSCLTLTRHKTFFCSDLLAGSEPLSLPSTGGVAAVGVLFRKRLVQGGQKKRKGERGRELESLFSFSMT